MKTKLEIAAVLKESRKSSGLSATNVIHALSERGISVSVKTLYGWENGHSQPSADTLLVLCELYGINDIMEAFGYTFTRANDSKALSPEECILLRQYRGLPEYAKEDIRDYVNMKCEKLISNRETMA